MALADVSNDQAHAPRSFNIPGLTKPARVGTALKEAKGEKGAAKKLSSKSSRVAVGGEALKKKRAPGTKKAAALVTTPPAATSVAKISATEHENNGTPEAQSVKFHEPPKTPYEPKNPYAASVVGAGNASGPMEDIPIAFKTPGNVTFAAHDDETGAETEDGDGDDSEESVDANGAKRVSRRAHARPERFGEFKSWNSVQKGTLGTPGHGLISKQARYRLGEARNDGEAPHAAKESTSGQSSGGVNSSSGAPAMTAQAAAAATPTTARFNAAASNTAVNDVHERVAALMRMADAALPTEDPAAAANAVDEKSLREQLSDSWNGQGYYAKLMTQMATPKKEGERSFSPSDDAKTTSLQPAHGAKKAAKQQQQPAVPGAAAVPLAVSGSGGGGVAKKLNGNALGSRATANAGWMLAGVVSQPKPASSPPQFGASSESEEALMALKRELDTTKAALVAAKEEAETLLADAALAESEAESLGNTLESQTLQLRAYNAENKALKAELAALRLNSFSKEKALQMGETIKNAIDAAVAKF